MHGQRGPELREGMDPHNHLRWAMRRAEGTMGPLSLTQAFLGGGGGPRKARVT